MKKSVKIILLVVVVALLGASLYFLKVDKNTNKNMVVLQIPEETVTQIRFQAMLYSDREVVIEKDEQNGLWKCEDVYIKEVFTKDIFNVIKDLRAKTEITSPDDLSQYGFDSPRVIINIKTTTDNYEIIIGGYNATEKAYYFKVSGSDSVYVTEDGSKLNYAFEYDTDAFINAQK